jgi:hypothetical protein
VEETKLCIVAYFDSYNYFQWNIALEKFKAKLGIEVISINAAPLYKKIHSDFKNDPYWNPLKQADVVFAYIVRRSTRHEPSGISWWTLPQFVKPFMKPEAKMIAQYDDEFLWLFDPKGMWWDTSIMPNPPNQGPEEFFKDTGILEIPDAHLVVTNNFQLQKYTTKPVFKLFIPQLCRYNLRKYSENHKGNNIAMMLHSPKSSSISASLENVIRPKNYPVTVFNGTLDRHFVENFRRNTPLPVNSIVYERLEYEPYADLLWRTNSIGLDNNIGYGGWSRFAMECAITCIPCVGSSDSVHDIFPELYTTPIDYVKQIELIERLKTDKEFYHKMVEAGRKRVLELFDDEKLCNALLDIFNKIGVSKTQLTLNDVPIPESNYKPDSQQAHPHP